MCNNTKLYNFVYLFSDKELRNELTRINLTVDYSNDTLKGVFHPVLDSTDLTKTGNLDIKRKVKLTLYKENDYYQFYKVRKNNKTFYFKLPYHQTIDFTRINNDVNGNPRYVCHFLNLVTDAERPQRIQEKYNLALQRAKNMGGKKYHNKTYGGGIVFQSYNLVATERDIKETLKNSSIIN